MLYHPRYLVSYIYVIVAAFGHPSRWSANATHEGRGRKQKRTPHLVPHATLDIEIAWHAPITGGGESAADLPSWGIRFYSLRPSTAASCSISTSINKTHSWGNRRVGCPRSVKRREKLLIAAQQDHQVRIYPPLLPLLLSVYRSQTAQCPRLPWVRARKGATAELWAMGTGGKSVFRFPSDLRYDQDLGTPGLSDQ